MRPVLQNTRSCKSLTWGTLALSAGANNQQRQDSVQRRKTPGTAHTLLKHGQSQLGAASTASAPIPTQSTMCNPCVRARSASSSFRRTVTALLPLGGQHPSFVSASHPPRQQCKHRLAQHGPSVAKIRLALRCCSILQCRVTSTWTSAGKQEKMGSAMQPSIMQATRQTVTHACRTLL